MERTRDERVQDVPPSPTDSPYGGHQKTHYGRCVSDDYDETWRGRRVADPFSTPEVVALRRVRNGTAVHDRRAVRQEWATRA